MLDTKRLRNDPEGIARILARRGFAFDLERFNSLESERKRLQVETQELQNLRNTRSKAIGRAKAQGEDVQPLLDEVADLGDRLGAAKTASEAVQAELDGLLMGMPNLPHESVPQGDDEDANIEVRRWGEPRSFDFEPRDHVDIGTALGGLDFEAAARISGARFAVLRGELARLQRALTQFMLDTHTREHGYRRGLRPVSRAVPGAGGHWTAAQVRGGSVPHRGRSAVLPHPHRRGAGNQPGARADRRSREATAALRGAHAVFSFRGRFGRQAIRAA